MPRRQHMFISFGQPAIRRCNWCLEIEGEHGEGCHTRESLLQDVQALSGENKKLNDFSQGLVAINLSLTDQVSQLRERTKELEELNLKFYMDMQSAGMNSNVLNMELKELRAKTSTTMGVGSGDGKLFVHGDYESIKAAQAIIFENEALRKKYNGLVEQRKIDADLVNLHVNSLEAQLREAKENQTPISYDQHFKAWSKIVKVLDDVASGWTGGKHKEMSFMDAAVSTIKDLAADAKKFRALQPCHFANRVTEVSNERGVITSVDAEIEGPVRENVFYYFPFGQPK